MKNNEKVVASEEHDDQGSKSSGFMDIRIDRITVKERIRTGIDEEGDSFNGLVESIRRQGVLEPIIVIESGDFYELLCGERRLRASQRLNLTTIPARILKQQITGYDRIEIELIENLFRQDLNPINEANGYRRYFEERLNLSLDEAVKNLIWHGLKDERAQENIVEGISTIVTFSGKSSKTIQNLLRLLKLPSPIQKAIEMGKINVSLGGVFVSNINHSMLMDIFHSCCEKPMTKKALIKAFDQHEGQVNKQANLYGKYSKNVESIRQSIRINADHIGIERARKLHEQLKGLIDQIEEMMEAGDFM